MNAGALFVLIPARRAGNIVGAGEQENNNEAAYCFIKKCQIMYLSREALLMCRAAVD